LNLDHNFPQFAIDTSTFARALDSGALDTCLAQLRHNDLAGPDVAKLICDLSEKLFHGGRSGDALECGRLVFAAAANDNDVVHFCAWLFSNCGCYREAAVAYEQLIERRPEWVEGYRHASGALAAIGDIERAIHLAMQASDLAPEQFEFAFHAGCLLLDAKRGEEARAYLGRAVVVEPKNPRALRTLSAANYLLERVDEALNLALRAAALAPRDNEIAIYAIELLLRGGRIDDALALLDAAIEHDPSDATLWRLVSAAEAQRGETRAALAAVEYALKLVPDNAEYHLHLGHLFYRCGDFARAAEAINRAVSLDPASQAARRAQLDLLVADGRLAEATAIGGELLRAFPEDGASAEAVLRVLNCRLDTIDGDYVVVANRSRRLLRPPSDEPGLIGRLRSQARVIHALMIRETRTRFGDSRLGYGWALIEPILHILLLSTVFSLLMHGNPPIGTHLFVFYYTGLIRYYGAKSWKQGKRSGLPIPM
jgi:tetratricopeptide (TPR) repeat protein